MLHEGGHLWRLIPWPVIPPRRMSQLRASSLPRTGGLVAAVGSGRPRAAKYDGFA